MGSNPILSAKKDYYTMTPAPTQIPISEGGKRILGTVHKELFPLLRKISDLVIETQRLRISFHLFSWKLNKIELRYNKTSEDFFAVTQKLQTPDLLFEGLDDNPQYMMDYFTFAEAFQKNINQGIDHLGIIDRTLDRKFQNIWNRRALVLSTIAIIVSIWFR